MFEQVLEPFGTVAGGTLLALVPVAVLLVLLAAVRMTAWQAHHRLGGHRAARRPGVAGAAR